MNRLPMAIPAALALVVATLVGGAYTLLKLDLRGPASGDRFTVRVEMDDAAGLAKAHNPLVMVAGTKQGRVTDVAVRGRRAVVTLSLDRSVEGRIFRDAQVSVRPLGVIPVLMVEVTPGTPKAGALEDDSTIAADRSDAYVAPDKLLSVMDTDTRAYVQTLLAQAGTALDGRGSDLERAVVELAPTAASGKEVAEAVADRQQLVSRLVRNLATVSRTLARRRAELGRSVDAGGQVLSVTAGRSDAIERAMQQLPPTIQSAERAVRELRAVARPLSEGLDGLEPVLAELPGSLRALRDVTPETRRLLRNLDALQQEAKQQLPALREFTSKLGSSAAAALPDVQEAAKTTEALGRNADGMAQTADLLSGSVSTRDANGTLSRVVITAVENLKPENFGLIPPTGAANARARSRMQQDLRRTVAALLENQCEEQQFACLLRVMTPGLPGNPSTPTTAKREGG